jgi:hypothetical protein
LVQRIIRVKKSVDFFSHNNSFAGWAGGSISSCFKNIDLPPVKKSQKTHECAAVQRKVQNANWFLKKIEALHYQMFAKIKINDAC